MKFVDEAQIYVRAGKGGNGIVVALVGGGLVPVQRVGVALFGQYVGQHGLRADKSLFRGLTEMEGGALQIGRGAHAFAIDFAELPVCDGKPLLGGFVIEAAGDGQVGFAGEVVVLGEEVLPERVALSGGFARPIDGLRFVVVGIVFEQAQLRRQYAAFAQPYVFAEEGGKRFARAFAQVQQVVNGVGMVLFGGDFQPRDGGLDVRFGLLQKDAGQLERGLGMTLTGGLLQQRQCLPGVGRILRQQLVCLPEKGI